MIEGNHVSNRAVARRPHILDKEPERWHEA
jgi:hypothetical protein